MSRISVGLLGLACLIILPGCSRTSATNTDLVERNTAFALDLYSRLREREGNIFLSPYSVSTTLAMSYAGARGRTAEEIAQVLHFPLDQTGLHGDFSALVADIHARAEADGNQMLVANALWGQEGFPFQEDYLNTIQQHYGAGLRTVDFEAPEKARQTINGWAARQTHDKIGEVLPTGSLTADSKLALISSIYFQGHWATKFNKSWTRKGDFWLTASSKVPVPMMFERQKLKRLEKDPFSALELPYAGNDVSMVIFLPNARDGLAKFERSLTPAKLDQWLSELPGPVDVDVSLPRFKIAMQFDLKKSLEDLGMAQPFDKDRADFTGMSGDKKGLVISDIVHSAFVEVNEEGTKAAAAVAVVYKKKGGSVPHAEQFRADHPFFFLIRDNRTGSLLFLGRVMDPRP